MVTGFSLGKKPLIGIAAAGAIIAAVLVFSQSGSSFTTSADSNPVVAEVDGQEILLDEVNDAVRIASTQGAKLDNSTALDQIITKTLLLEEAQRRNIVVTMDDAAKELENTYTKNGLTKQQFEDRLAQLGTTYEQTLDLFRQQMIINKVLSSEITNADIQVSDREAMAFFNDNLDQIKSQVGNNTVFDDVSSQIKDSILLQKQRQMVTDLVSKLKDQATILTFKDRM